MKPLFFDYLILQGKRARRLLPQLLALTLLLALCAVLAGTILSVRRAGEDAKQKIRIGVVGQMDNAYPHIALYALQTLDSTRFSLSLEPMEEAQAAAALDAGTLDGYICIPEGFLEGLMLGEHRALRFVSAGSAAGLGSRLTQELLSSVETLLLESENAVYGAQTYVAEVLPGTDPYDAGDELVMRYLLTVLDRSALFELETVGAADGLSFPGYYLCGLAVAFLLLSGLNAGPLIARRSEELGRILRASGLHVVGQVLAEYLPFAALSLCAAFCAGVLAAIAAGLLGLRVPELAALTAGETAVLCLRALPTLLMLAAMQFALYELVPSAVGGLLLQFLNALVQSYAAGCFYPASFFPAGLRSFGAALPAGAARRTLCALVAPGSGTPADAAVTAYLLVFLALAAALRARRLRT